MMVIIFFSPSKIESIRFDFRNKLNRIIRDIMKASSPWSPRDFFFYFAPRGCKIRTSFTRLRSNVINFYQPLTWQLKYFIICRSHLNKHRLGRATTTFFKSSNTPNTFRCLTAHQETAKKNSTRSNCFFFFFRLQYRS